MKLRKTFFCLILLSALLFTVCLPGAEAASYKVPFEIASDAVYLVNQDTGAVLLEKNPEKLTYPASLTKIMTAIVLLEEMEKRAEADGCTVKEMLEKTQVTAPAYIYNEFAGLGVSTADIRAGETLDLLDTLYAMLLQSACEASSIIADYIGDGQVSRFVEMMNAKAQQIGALNTHFSNPHGLFDAAQVTTAKDMYRITAYALTVPLFEEVCTSTSYLMKATNKHPSTRYVTHTNYMLSSYLGGSMYYEKMRGIKTGSLPEVGKNLVSMASDNGYNYLLVTLGAPTQDADGKSFAQNQSYVDAKKIYEWAFSSFKLQTVLQSGEVIEEVPVKLGAEQDFAVLAAKEDVHALLPVDTDPSALQRNIALLSGVTAPVKKGDVLGKMELRLADEAIATVDLVAVQGVDRSLPLYLGDASKRFFAQRSVFWTLAALLFLILLALITSAHRRKRIRLQRKRQRKYSR